VRTRRSAPAAADLERIYRTRYGAFLRVAAAIVRDEHVAEEVVHDGFVRALRHRRGFAGKGSLDAWLWQIVVNEARRRSAAERRAVPQVSAGLANSVAAPNGHHESGAVVALVAALPERQRLALFLRYYADLDYEAIAAALDVAPGTVAATLHAAQSSLRRDLLEVER
jgi:RNA polymerase sigma-70 factor, ECF subfamily